MNRFENAEKASDRLDKAHKLSTIIHSFDKKDFDFRNGDASIDEVIQLMDYELSRLKERKEQWLKTQYL